MGNALLLHPGFATGKAGIAHVIQIPKATRFPVLVILKGNGGHLFAYEQCIFARDIRELCVNPIAD